ncbi:LysR family transcriptional regulator [Marinovum sp. 2_MG-2023]|uniref:LysR family transcriptional regulator n=1 Tax=Roseobacteraceae TaxID=2854170 RepID=UPI001FD3FE5E|nr:MULTISPECIES: LysR family transcriptional regulator [Roseobacteraceae]MCJ7871801.1 LysR family transcriptional regulator [Phaeobacter sp. J2-8]MDO6728643.1 LysR family transcriptional regulator [Marinovum sp. 2_MG-2023]MDO6777941.1 LysR family transcriptional regulator [Marinovum sp. 1_MG-2023]
MDNWSEVRTAYQVAIKGTVSGAAEVLGVHHATVIRHIDALEAQMGAKLFQRHARGYTPTEAGEDLLRVAQATEDQFNQLQGRIKGRGEGVAGELVVTSLVGMSTQFAPVMADFQREYPDVILRYLTGDRLFRLEYGEAHVAIRAGSAPEQPDNVVQPFFRHPFALYASRDYVEAHGMPQSDADLAGHRLVSHDEMRSRAPIFRWLNEQVPESSIVFRSSDMRALTEAVLAGAGIGFVPVYEAKRHEKLVQVMPQREEWATQLWLVTHVDLHRAAKVQAFLNFLKARAREWEKTCTAGD